jgi:hypothetical protein
MRIGQTVFGHRTRSTFGKVVLATFTLLLSNCGQTSLSNEDVASCRDWLISTDELNALTSSADSTLSEDELVEIFLSWPSSDRLDGWDELFFNYSIQLREFGVPEHDELSELVFAAERKYQSSRITFSITKSKTELRAAFDEWSENSNRLSDFCEAHA